MGLFTGVLLLPLAPVRGTIWIAERLLDEAEREAEDPANIELQLEEAESRYERGQLSQEEYEQLEDELLRRLIARGGL